ncbi:MAG TPA: C25 family cysteine peptidase [Blastocatellia bacterium]|nr:C25 family cysteine peptidase [Blastocatellia bacterium]
MTISALAVLGLASRRFEEAAATAVLQKRAPAAIFTVNSTGDQADLTPGDGVCLTANGDCTLRAAIEETNALAGADTINFNIGAGTPSITPATALPSITDKLTIDGNSGGATRVQINGSGVATAGTHGLVLVTGSSGSAIRSLVIRQWTGNGVRIQSDNNLIENNYIGTNETGSVAAANGAGGVVISGGSGNTIGGLTVTAGTAPGNVISGNDTNGVMLTAAATMNSVQGNLIGIAAGGATALRNTGHGVLIDSAPANTIGGSTTTARNIITGGTATASFGVSIQGETSDNNTIAGNYIGTDITGMLDIGAGGDGVRINSGPDNNTIGGPTLTPGTPPGNVISGNGATGCATCDGIEIVGSSTTQNTTTGNKVQGNIIGLKADGMSALKNERNGVNINDASSTTIGGSSAMERNVISGNNTDANTDGIDVNGENADNNTIAGNYIGTNINGTAAIANGGNGVFVNGGPDNNTIGGSTLTPGTPPGNVISGNTGDGVELLGGSSSGHLVRGNLIGLQAGGAAALGNGANGVLLNAVTNSTVGGATSDLRNVISANGANGVQLNEGIGGVTDNNAVSSNYIGTDITGMNDLGNTSAGVHLVQADGVTVGGITATPGTSPGNVISGNNTVGIDADNANDDAVQGNLIGLKANGTDAMPNTSHGIHIRNTSVRIAVGGTAAGAANTIAFNGGDGVNVAGASSNGNSIRANSIYSNTGLGIDLTGGTENANGVTANDANDSDSGANTLQNYPVITAASVSGGSTTVAGTLNSTPNMTFAIEFYSMTTADPSGNGEATSYRGSTSVTTNASGNASFSGIVLTTTDPLITATATNTTGSPANNTSEFAADFTATSPTAVRLESFKALADDSGKVYLEWRTGYEADNLGFNLYREVRGQRARINPSLIAGSALIAGQDTVLAAGDVYSWVDARGAAETAAMYWLEDIDLSGGATLHGPFFTTPVDKLPAEARAVLLNEIKDSGNSAQRQLLPATASRKGMARLSADRLANDSLAKQWEIAAQAGVKLLIKQAGWYRITQPELIAAGLDPMRDPRFLQLFADGQEVAMLVNGGLKGRLDSTDSIEFFATPLDTPETAAHAYYLTFGAQPGRRIAGVSGLPDKPGAAQSFDYTTELKPRLLYFPSIKNGDADNWFGPIISSTPYTLSLNVSLPDLQAASPATLDLVTQGLGLNVGHGVSLSLNGSVVGTTLFDGQAHSTTTFTLPMSLLRDGDNSITLQALNGPSDFSVLDAVRLTYAHRFAADNDALLMNVEGGQTIQVSGFPQPAVRLFDITEAISPVEIQGQVEADGNSYRLTAAVPAGSGARLLYAVSDAAVRHPAQVIAQRPSTWNRAANGADLIIISHASLIPSLAPLKQLRLKQGYSVAVVDVEDLFDEFSFGAHSAAALRDFITRAHSLWKKKPGFVLLAGDASYDPRNYLGLGDNDFVPTGRITTLQFETASDEWLGDSDGDGLAEVALGRLPVRSAESAALVVGKLLNYEKQRHEGALLVADRNDGYNFEAATAVVKSLLPPGLAVTNIYRSQMDDAAAHQAVMAGLSRGPLVVNYAGHGSASVWRGSLLVTSDAAGLSNRDQLTVVISMTCLNGLFNDPRTASLGEALLLTEGGAAAVWASSAQTSGDGQALMNQEVMRQLFAGATTRVQGMTIGEATRRARQAVSDSDVRRSWVLLGDPTMRVK